MHWLLVREMPEKVTKDKTWQWFSKSDSKIRTEALLYTAQKQAMRTNYVKYHINKTSENLLCSLFGEKGESVQHLVSGREKLTRKNYKRQYENEAKKVHWNLYKKKGLGHTGKWCERIPEGAVENEVVKVLWDTNVQCNKLIEARRPDII